MRFIYANDLLLGENSRGPFLVWVVLISKEASKEEDQGNDK